MTARLSWAVPWLAAGLLGCDATPPPTRCVFGTEHVVATTVAKGHEALELVSVGETAVAVWSEPAGLFARALGPNGVPLAPVRRLGPHCGGGLSAAVERGRVLVACLSHPSPGPAADAEDPGDAGDVLLYELDPELKVVGVERIGAPGPLSRGVALRVGDGARYLAWHDGSVEAQRVWFTRLGSEGRPTQLSGKGNVAGAPSMVVTRGKPRVTWAERWLVGEELESRIMLWEGQGQPRPLGAVHHLAAMPQVLEHRERLLVAFRDYEGRGSRAGLYVTYLDASRRMGEPIRVARADGVYRPSLASCLEGVIAATPRTYGGDYFVGVARLDHDLNRPRPEQQFYEDSHAFTLAAVACVGERALIVIAEHGALHIPETRLRAVAFDCR